MVKYSYDYSQIKYNFKVVLLGEAGVGKTSIIERYCFNQFPENTQPTIGLSFHSVIVDAKQGSEPIKIGLSLWDFGGQERFQALLPQFILGANGALLIFDISQPSTLEKLERWKLILEKYVKNIPIHLIGNKKDLVETGIVKDIDPIRLQNQQKILHFTKYNDSSAKTGLNTGIIFKDLLLSIYLQNYPNLPPLSFENTDTNK